MNTLHYLVSLSAELFTDQWKLCLDCLAAEYAEILFYFPELQKNGDFPRQFKRPHMDAADKRPHHNRRKSHSSCRNNRWPQEKKETQKESSRSHKGREKHRKADRCHEADEDFPRGPKLRSSPGPFKTQKAPKSFHHSSHSHKPREDKLPREGKRSKHKKKESYLEADGSDNLFLIKQRKKKSKLWDSFRSAF